MSEIELTIYDVLRALVSKTNWLDEQNERRMLQAIARAEENEIFRTEGRFKL